MSPVLVQVGRGLGVVLGAVLATAALGQQVTVSPIARGKVTPPDPNAPGSVHPIEIQQGPNRRVDYVTQGNLPASDRMAVIELQRAENELAYVNNLQRLKAQYVNDERTLQPQRRYVQELLYGSSISYGGYTSGLIGGGGYGSVYPYAWGGYGAYGGGAYGAYGYGGYGGYLSGGGYSSVTRNLQFGMGDEGVLKNTISQVIAVQATPEYADAVVRNYENAVARAETSPPLARALSFRKGEVRPVADLPIRFRKGDRLVLTLKGGDKVTGTLVDENIDWVVIRTATGQVTVRKAEINRAETPAKPAADEGKK